MLVQRVLASTTFSLPAILNPTSVFACIGSNLHTSTVLDRWYKRFFQLKRVFTPPKNPFTYTNDWENQPYSPLDPNSFMSLAQKNDQFASIEESAKQMFTYRFASQEEQLKEQIRKELVRLGFEPTDQSVAAKIVRMTVELRYRKWLFDQHPRNKTLRANLSASMRARQRLLRLLRSTNQTEFEHLQSALAITGYLHPDPYQMPTNDPTVARKIAVRKECYQLRLAKLASFKNQIRSTEHDFYKRKQTALNQIMDRLVQVQTVAKSEESKQQQQSREEASKLLKQLFDEVVKERQSEELLVPQTDRLNWYALEAKQREEYLANKAQKAEKQLRRLRK